MTHTAVVFLDLQDEIVKNARTISLDRLIATAGALAKLSTLHGLPAFASSVPPGGPYLPSLIALLPGLAPRPRTQTTAFADAGLVDALRAADVKTLILAGVASEIVVQRTALDALAAGFAVQLAVDACGGIDARTEDAAFRRVVAAGGVTTSVITVAAELAGDFTTEKGGATLGIAYEAIGAAAR
jgi:nicotinamidase-related amidase